MSYSQTTLINKVLNLLEVNHDFYGSLTAGVTNSATTIPVNDGTDWAEGDILEFQPDGELARVRSVSSNDLTVVRGAFGTTAVSHSSGDAVIKSPSVTIQLVKDSIESVFQELWPQAWKVTTDTITPADSTDWYDLDAAAIDLVSVYQHYTSGVVPKLGIFGDKGQQRPVIFNRHLPTALAASGVGMAFPGGVYHVSNDITVKFRAKFTGAVSGGNYTEIDAGIPVEVLAYGAAARIAMGKESPKVVLEDQAQGEHNTSSGDRLALAAILDNRFQRTLNKWHELLYSESPPLGTVA